MNATELFTERDGARIPVGHVCDQCGAAWLVTVFGRRRGGTRRMAEECCQDPTCEECGAKAPRGWTFCRKCNDAHARQAEAERFAACPTKTPLAEYRGTFVYVPGGPNDGYVLTEDVEDALRTMRAEGRPLPTYGWATLGEKASFNLRDTILDYVHDNHHEAAQEHVDEALLDMLQPLVDRAIADVETFEESHDEAILLPEPKDEAEENVTCEGCDEEVPRATATFDPEDSVHLCATCAAQLRADELPEAP